MADSPSADEEYALSNLCKLRGMEWVRDRSVRKGKLSHVFDSRHTYPPRMNDQEAGTSSPAHELEPVTDVPDAMYEKSGKSPEVEPIRVSASLWAAIPGVAGDMGQRDHLL